LDEEVYNQRSLDEWGNIMGKKTQHCGSLFKILADFYRRKKWNSNLNLCGTSSTTGTLTSLVSQKRIHVGTSYLRLSDQQYALGGGEKLVSGWLLIIARKRICPHTNQEALDFYVSIRWHTTHFVLAMTF